MLLHAFSNDHISSLMFDALGASCHDKRSTLGAAAALAHATAKGCSSRLLQQQTQFAARLLAVDMLLHAFSSDHISSLMFDALGASCHDKRSMLGAIAALAHATAKGCSSPQQQLQTQFTVRLLAVDMLLHAFSSAHISNLMFDALGASCHDKRSVLGAIAALAHATAKGCNSRLLQPQTQFAARLLAADMLLHAFSNDHISSLMLDALGASCHDKRSTLGAAAALAHATAKGCSSRLLQPSTQFVARLLAVAIGYRA